MASARAEDAAKDTEEKTVLDFSLKSLKGEDVELKKYKDKVIVAVNVASRCGYTPQYADLESLQKKYKDKGLVVLGFPCNQFGKQEPGTSEEIAEFCSSKYGVTFDMFEKVEVNGDGACDLYKYLTSVDSEPVGKGKVSWNFEKFLIGRDGKVAARFRPGTKPMDKDFIEVVEKLLADK